MMAESSVPYPGTADIYSLLLEEVYTKRET